MCKNVWIHFDLQGISSLVKSTITHISHSNVCSFWWVMGLLMVYVAKVFVYYGCYWIRCDFLSFQVRYWTALVRGLDRSGLSSYHAQNKKRFRTVCLCHTHSYISLHTIHPSIHLTHSLSPFSAWKETAKEGRKDAALCSSSHLVTLVYH